MSKGFTDEATALSQKSKTEGETPVEHIFKATGYSLAGLKATFQHEMAFRIECVLLILLLPVLYFIDTSIVLKSVILMSMFLVLLCELLNSALEWIVDYISLDKHPYAKRAKDMGSAAVFCALTNCGLQWALGLLSSFGVISL